MPRVRGGSLGLVVSALLVTSPLLAQVAPERAPRRARTNALEVALQRRLVPLLDSAPFERALWGIAVSDPTGRIVFERNGGRLFVPASNTKLIVTAVAVALLPDTFRFRTSVYGDGPVVNGVLQGDIVLYGRGDPTLSDRYERTRLAAFERLVEQLRERGIERVDGDVVGDASYFDSVVVHPSWEGYDLNWWYGAPVTALGFNDNSVDFLITPGAVGEPPRIDLTPELGVVELTNLARTVPADRPRTLDFHRVPGTNRVFAVGDVPVDARPWTENFAVHDAPAYAAAAFRRALESRGITVTGRTRGNFDPGRYASARARGALAERLSRPLPDVIRPILEISHNWYAEMLLKTLGRELRGVGSWEAGLDVERRFLIDVLRVDSTAFRLADASGLSHWNLVTPAAFVQLLNGMRHHPRGEAFRGLLPVGGESGTLRFRFRNSPVSRLVRAKTGSIASTNTLSGYLELPGGTWTFSIQLNHHTARNRDALRRIDEIVEALVR